jgi:hypothetical protein
MENAIYAVLLAFHNIALVGCAAAPFYNLRLTGQRGKHGQKIFYELDKVVEDTLQGLEPYCWVFLFTLVVTGIGFPVTHYAFHGEFKDISTVALTGLIIKLLFVFGMAVIAFYIAFSVNPKIKEILLTFVPGAQLAEEKRKVFFALRGTRRRLCKVCFVFALIILIVTPLLRFY